jgi:hypothetical protein
VKRKDIPVGEVLGLETYKGGPVDPVVVIDTSTLWYRRTGWQGNGKFRKTSGTRYTVDRGYTTDTTGYLAITSRQYNQAEQRKATPEERLNTLKNAVLVMQGNELTEDYVNGSTAFEYVNLTLVNNARIVGPFEEAETAYEASRKAERDKWAEIDARRADFRKRVNDAKEELTSLAVPHGAVYDRSDDFVGRVEIDLETLEELIRRVGA